MFLATLTLWDWAATKRSLWKSRRPAGACPLGFAAYPSKAVRSRAVRPFASQKAR